MTFYVPNSLSTPSGWIVSGPDRYGGHTNAISPTIEIFEGDTIEMSTAHFGDPFYITTSPVTGMLNSGTTPQGQVSWFPHQGAATPGTYPFTAPAGSAGDYYYGAWDLTSGLLVSPSQGILRVHPPLHFDDPHIGAGSVNKYLLAANPRPGDVVGLSAFPSRWYQQQLKGRRRDEEAISNNPPNMQLYPRENVYHRGFNIHQDWTVPGQQEYTTAGTYSWTCPDGVTSVCVVAVGAGGPLQGSSGAGGFDGCSGGGLGWKNNITVVPGQSYTVVVGTPSSGTGGDSYFINTSTVKGGGGTGSYQGGSVAGDYYGDGGGNGGVGGSRWTWDGYGAGAGGGGGAGGYSGDGGAGGKGGSSYQLQSAPNGDGPQGGNGVDGQGGGGGGAGGAGSGSAGGGGVGIYGEGTSGTGGTKYTYGSSTSTPMGTGGSGGGDGGGTNTNGGDGGLYGGGSGSYGNGGPVGTSSGGAVRIIWGDGRAFPSTNTADV